MTTRDDPWPQGTPCWVDGLVPDASAACAFYAELFGWEMVVGAAQPDGYAVARMSGRPVAGIGPPPPGSQLAPVWSTYLAVDDVDAMAARVTACGGRILLPPTDVLEQGRMAVAADPTGAVFGMWQAGSNRGARIVNEPGALTWSECMTRDYARAGRFYADVFGYEMEEMGDAGFRYCVLNLGGAPVGGLGELGPDIPADLPPHWMSYFAVADTDDVVKRAADLGAQVRMQPQDTPYGRMAVLEGVQGEVFAVISAA